MSETEKTILINCPECPRDIYMEGLNNMINHILECHKNYTPYEAEVYASMWMEDAFAEDEEIEAKAAENDRINFDIGESIDRDIQFQKRRI